MDIHDYNGRLALEAASLLDAFRPIIHVGGAALRVLDKHGAVLLDMPDGDTGSRPEVQRGDLCRILLASLPVDIIRWGYRLAEATPSIAGRHRLTFDNGFSTDADLVVGADGAWSRVRPLLSDAKPAYVGTFFIETYLKDADRRHAATAAAVRAGALFTLAPGKGILAHRKADAVLHAYIALAKPKDWMDRIEDADDASAQVLAEFNDWAPALTSLIIDGAGEPIVRPIYALPADHRWDRVPGVTLLGDAAHLMSPFAGEGANLAMMDGAALAKAIATTPNGLDTALRAYEPDLFERSQAAAVEAAANLATMFADDAPAGLMRIVAGADDHAE